ncbi:hypothetical protein FOL47_000796, partial [Perkinsus chesapeaki]
MNERETRKAGPEVTGRDAGERKRGGRRGEKKQDMERQRLRRRGRGRKRARKMVAEPMQEQWHVEQQEWGAQGAETGEDSGERGELWEEREGGVVSIAGVEVPRITPIVKYEPDTGDVHYYQSGRYYQEDPTTVLGERHGMDPGDHMRLARAVVHPNDVESKLPTTLALAIERAAEKGAEIAKERQELCAQIADVAQKLEPLREEWAKELPKCCQKLHLPLLYYLAEITQYPDVGSIIEMKEYGGLAFKGRLEAEGIFAPRRESGKAKEVLSAEECRDITQQRLEGMQRSVREVSEEEKWLWEEARKEVGQGRLDGPHEVDDMMRWEAAGATTRHVVIQPGKLRPCDDYRRSQVNRMMDVRHKVTLPELETTVGVVKRIWKAYGKPIELNIWKRDHRDAYRQIPLRRAERGWTTVVLRDPADGRMKGFRHHVFPFGSVSSVTAYLRVGMLMTHVSRVAFACGMQSYRDDFYVVEAANSAASSFEAFGKLNEACGFAVKHEKDVGPGKVAKVLGIEVSLVRPEEVQFRLDTGRRDALMSAVSHALRNGFPAGASGRKLAGRLSFACSVLEGRCGRAHVRTVIRAAMTGTVEDEREIQGALRGIFKLLGKATEGRSGRVIPYREGSDGYSEPRKHVIVYADATGEGGIGMVATAADGEQVWYGQAQVPEWYKAGLLPRENQVMAYELYAIAAAIATFCTDTQRKYLVFTDSEVVRTMVNRGSGRPSDMNELVGHCWEHLAHELVNVFFSRVASETNPADGPSRGKPAVTGWKQVPVKVPTFMFRKRLRGEPAKPEEDRAAAIGEAAQGQDGGKEKGAGSLKAVRSLG